MNLSALSTALLAIILGVAVFVFPQGLGYIVATYLVLIGIVGLVNLRRR